MIKDLTIKRGRGSGSSNADLEVNAFPAHMRSALNRINVN